MPKRFFSCEPLTINKVAEVKAFVTGTDINSAITPKFRIDINSSMHPAKKVNIITNCGGLSNVYCKVSMDIKDVGPMEISLIVPRNT